MWIKISPEQGHAARTHTPRKHSALTHAPAAFPSSFLLPHCWPPSVLPALASGSSGTGMPTALPAHGGTVTWSFRAGCTHAEGLVRTSAHVGTAKYTRAHRAGTSGLTPHRDTHGYPCTDLTHTRQLQLPWLSGHTQKPRDIMAGTHLDLFSS